MEYPRDYNAGVDFVDRIVEEGLGENTAFIDAQGSITYGELNCATDRMGRLLDAHGVGREDRIAMIVLDTIDFPIIFWGAIKAGVVPVAINTMLTTEQYRYMLTDSRARVLFVSVALLPVVETLLGDLPALGKVFVIGGETAGHGEFRQELAKHPDDFRPARTCSDEVAFWLYSSGSTGQPKGVKHIHTSLMETARLYGKGVLGIRRDDVVFSAAKLFFAYGLGNGMSFPMSVGATTVLLADRPTPAAVFDILARHQPTIFYGVPTLYAAILAEPALTAESGSRRLRLCVSAGEALPKEIGVTWRTRFGVDILDGVGSTELLHIYLSNTPDEVNYGFSGRPVPGYQVRLVDEDGGGVEPGDIGELLVRGPTAADGYWNQRAKSRTTFEGEWTRTGDKYTRDGRGIFLYCGRTDDMFKVSGIWVSPFEVESALISHDSVLEAAVVPAEDEEGLLKPKAFIVLKYGRDSSSLTKPLQEHVKQEVGNWKYPRWIEYVDSLPKTATGKIQRFKLRDP